ncbi:MAG: AbgT family transporter, partial [Gammaproteobacteria bacterium]|nr:AbgT family transporter [Gammaproteobacteria bacterium]
MTDTAQEHAQEMKGFLAWVERSGNKLPDPVFIFLWCILAVVLISVVAALAGVSVLHPTQVDGAGNAIVVVAESLLSADNIQRLLVE